MGYTYMQTKRLTNNDYIHVDITSKSLYKFECRNTV